MLSFLARRLAQTVPILVAAAGLIFVLFSVIPGSFESSLADDGRSVIDEETAKRIRKELGLDLPIHVRFVSYVGKLATFDLGTSFRSRQPVTTVIGERLWPTLKLAFAATLLAMLFGIPLGFIAAMRPGSLIDSASMVFAVSGLSLPKFWLGLLLMYLFALKLGWLPSFGYGTGGLTHLTLPAIALGVSPLGLLARTTRAAVLDIMNADFVRTARSKGMSEVRVVQWHLARNALVIVLTTVGLQFGSVIGQAVVVEKLFAWPGLGSLLVDSVSLRDIPVVQGCIITLVLFFLIVNLAVDVLAAAIDPRIRYT